MPPIGKPTLGYPCQIDAIFALHSEGRKAQEICDLLGCSKEVVYSAVSRRRKRTGAKVVRPPNEPSKREMKQWMDDEFKLRREVTLRAQRGAREALEALSQ